MVDYSRFDHIGSDSDSGDDAAEAVGVPKPSAAATALRPPDATASATARSTTSTPSIIGSALPQAASNAGGGGSSSSGGREEGPAGGGAGGSASFSQPMMMTASKKGKEGRIKFEHEGVFLTDDGRRCDVTLWTFNMRHDVHQTDHFKRLWGGGGADCTLRGSGCIHYA